MNEYVTIKEACELTGKSDRTIRRNIINVQDKLNLTSQTPIVSKQMSKYYVLKSYLIEFYNLDKSLDKPRHLTKETIKKSNKKQKKDPYLDKYIDKLEKENADLIRVRDVLLDTNKEMTRQNDQSQKLIGQLQQTNKTLLLGEREKGQAPVIKEDKESSVWMVISVIILIVVAILIYKTF
jgi:hypothetical protein